MENYFKPAIPQEALAYSEVDTVKSAPSSGNRIPKKNFFILGLVALGIMFLASLTNGNQSDIENDIDSDIHFTQIKNTGSPEELGYKIRNVLEQNDESLKTVCGDFNLKLNVPSGWKSSSGSNDQGAYCRVSPDGVDSSLNELVLKINSYKNTISDRTRAVEASKDLVKYMPFPMGEVEMQTQLKSFNFSGIQGFQQVSKVRHQDGTLKEVLYMSIGNSDTGTMYFISFYNPASDSPKYSDDLNEIISSLEIDPSY